MAITLSHTAGALKQFRRRQWRQQRTFSVSRAKAVAAADAVVSLFGPESSGTATVDEVVFEPRELEALFARYGVARGARRSTYDLHDWTAGADNRDELAELLRAALLDGVDCVFQSTDPKLALYADHDEYLTFFCNSPGPLKSLERSLARAGISPVDDYRRAF